MPTIRIPIIEGKQIQAKLFHRLPEAAKKLFVIIARATKASGDPVPLDRIRNTGLFGSTSDIEQLLHTLESRGFGEMEAMGVETYFIPNKTLMQSVL